jgi:hypothetical protein
MQHNFKAIKIYNKGLLIRSKKKPATAERVALDGVYFV